MGFTPNLGRMANKAARSLGGNSKVANAAELLVGAGAEYLFDKGVKATMHEIHETHKKIRERIETIKIGENCTIGSIVNGTRPILNNNAENIVFKHYNSSEKIGLADATSIIYKTAFHTGQPSSQALYVSGRENVIDIKTLIDTERDYISSNKRSALTSVFGFNQRSYDFLLDDTFIKVQDYDFLFKNDKKKFNSSLANTSFYGDVFWEHTNIQIKSETDYYSIRLKLHLVKILDSDVDVSKLILSTVNSELNTSTSQGKLPAGRQLSIPKTFGNFRANLITDLKCTLNSSDWFKDNAKIVKTFHRTLGPSDIWDFDYYLHYGPGVLLNRIHEEMIGKETNAHPAGYFIIIQAEGDPRASITRTEDGENFNGTGPGRFTYSLQRRLKFVKKSYQDKTILTCRQFIKNDEDFEDSSFQEYFTPDREEKINISFNELNVNRVMDKKLEYQVRYGEGRLSLYIEPYLKTLLNNRLNNEEKEELNTTEVNNTETGFGDSLGDDQTDPTRSSSLRRN